MSDQYTPTGGQTIFPRINFLKTFSSRLEQRIANGRVFLGGVIDSLFGDATLDLNFARTKSIGDLVTYTRASTGTYVDANGVIQTAAANVPRFDHDPVTGESLGLLIEESRTNLAKYSEPDDRSTPGVSGEWRFADLDPNTEITKVEGPDGVSNSASEMQLATGSGWDAYLHHVPVTSGAFYTFSAWVKLGTATNLALHVNNLANWDTVPDGTYSFDVNDGLNTNTFVKVSHTFTAPSNGSVNVHIGRHGGTAPVQQTQGTVTVWGCQFELGAFSSSTIITSGSTVTRSPDIATIEGTNFSSWYNQSEGTVYSEFDWNLNNQSNITFPWYITDDGDNGNSVYLGNWGSTTQQSLGVRFNNPSVTSQLPIPGSTPGVSHKYATTLNAFDFAVALDGGFTGTYTGADLATSMTSLRIGGFDGSYLINGHISRFAYFPTRKTDQELIDLTT